MQVKLGPTALRVDSKLL